MRVLALAVLPMVLLAGCSGSDASNDPEADSAAPMHAGQHGANPEGTHLLAPEWAIGDSWTLTSDQGGTFSHVVSGDSGADWTMDTDNPDIAFFDAQGDISFLGKVRKSDLAGSQGTTRVEFLRFPLQANLSWSTTWDGNPTMIHVAKVADGKADLMAMRADGTTYATYTYDSKAGYFSRFTFFAPDGTTVGFEWSLQSSGSTFSGNLVRWALETVYETHGPFPGTGAQGFSVEPGITDVHIQLAVSCTQGAFSLHVGEPAGYAEERGFSATGPCPASLNETAALVGPTETEQWGIAFTAVPQATQATLDLTVLKRTMTSFAVGQAPA
ncbi:MAG: hypothetical protein ACYC2H_02640 [Thermoplasmatota archaeon]